VRVAHAVLGGAAGVVWLVLPVMTINTEVPVAAARAGTVAPVALSAGDGTSTADLVLPLVVVVGAGVLAGYGYVRRTRRARSRTTPGVISPQPPVPELGVLERQAGAALVQADDCVRTSREELAFAEAGFGTAAVGPFTRAVREAEGELSAAFAIRQRYDHGVPTEEAARRHALAGIVGRCAEAGRRLDAEAVGFDQLRGLEQGLGQALAVAETRFRELAGRAGTAEATLTDLGERCPPSATAPVTGYVEQAKDRLLFATSHLNRARQAADLGETGRATWNLRAAEGAVAQADVFVTAVDRLAAELTTAAGTVPAALTGAEAELSNVRRALESTATADTAENPALRVPAGELHTRLAHADTALAAVREELTTGPYDPLDALRRIVRATTPLGLGRTGVLATAAHLTARSATEAAAGFVTTHRGAVGAMARTRLAEAERLRDADAVKADTLAQEARHLAEQDVRAHGNPYPGTTEHANGIAGAVLGGILLAETPDGGPPTSFGGPTTRVRHGLPPAQPPLKTG
jgi:hypothetical protein